MRFGTTTLTQTNQGSGADQRIKKTETAGTSPADVVEYFYYTYCANNPVKYSDPSGHFIHIAIAIGFALWSAYDYYKEYKHAKKQGKSGWKLVKHMGGFVAKDLAFGKVKKAKKVGKAVLKTAKKVYKSKVIQRAIKKTYKSSHGRHIVTNKISHTGKHKKMISAFERGRAFEKETLNKFGWTKNTKKVGNSIPDAIVNGRIKEIKDVKYLTMSKQFREYFKSDMPVDVIVNKNTVISKPLLKNIKQSGGKVTRI